MGPLCNWLSGVLAIIIWYVAEGKRQCDKAPKDRNNEISFPGTLVLILFLFAVQRAYT